MKTTDEQKRIPLDQHMRLPFVPEINGSSKQYRPICTCGWRGRLSRSMDEARGQFATHTSKIWTAQHYHAIKENT